jgi:hypothetical protein
MKKAQKNVVGMAAANALKKLETVGKVMTEDGKPVFETVTTITMDVKITNKCLLCMHEELITGDTGGKDPVKFRLIQNIGGSHNLILYIGKRSVMFSMMDLCKKLVEVAVNHGGLR